MALLGHHELTQLSSNYANDRHRARKYMGKLNTVRCRYKVVNYLPNIHKRHPIARPIFWLNPCNYLCNILQYWTALLRHSTVRESSEITDLIATSCVRILCVTGYIDVWSLPWRLGLYYRQISWCRDAARLCVKLSCRTDKRLQHLDYWLCEIEPMRHFGVK